MTNLAKNKKRKSSKVPNQAGGYYLQETRVLMHLLNASLNDYIYLEMFGDVATEKDDGTKIIEENKLSIEHNPVTDRSENLWKTLFNWLNDIEKGEIDVNMTTFVIYVPKECAGNFIENLSSAKTKSIARKVIEEIKNELWGPSPKYEKKSELAQAIREYVNYVLEYDINTFETLVINFKFEKGSNGQYSGINEKLIEKTIPEEIIEEVRLHILGWIKEKIDKLIEAGKPVGIKCSEFISELRSYRRKIDQQRILTSFASEPEADEIEREHKIKKKYLQQVELINLQFDEQIQAINDFLMAEVDLYKWIEKGLVHESSAIDFEKSLIRVWNNKKGIVNIKNAGSDKDKGKEVYYECQGHKEELENNKVPDHFVPGYYHHLSNSIKLGWHPDWKKLIQ